ncbi:hypothetical protein BH10BAC6_BH10BAC6_06840 [soil metagenome]
MTTANARSDKPNLDLAREFTLAIGKPTMTLGLVIGTLSAVLVVMQSPLMHWYLPYYGTVLVIFGAAAYYRTEHVVGKVARWGVVLAFGIGGAISISHWASLLLTSAPVTVTPETLNSFAFYLMAGPALLVPALLALLRPGWTPLIVVPAILSLAMASMIGHGVFGIQYMLQAASHTPGTSILEGALVLGVVLCSTTLLLIALHRAWRVMHR